MNGGTLILLAGLVVMAIDEAVMYAWRHDGDLRSKWDPQSWPWWAWRQRRAIRRLNATPYQTRDGSRPDPAWRVHNLALANPSMLEVHPCPECTELHPVLALIAHLNDRHRWTFERIAAEAPGLDAPIERTTP